MKRSAPFQHYPDEVHSWSRVATASGEDGDIRDRLVKSFLCCHYEPTQVWALAQTRVAIGEQSAVSRAN